MELSGGGAVGQRDPSDRVGLQTAIGIGLALELNRLRRGRTLVLSLLLIPVMIAPVIAGFQFRMILNDQYGPLNYLLDALTFGRVHGYAWLADPGVALWAVMAADVWQWTPFMTLVVLAGLQSLPGELLEAAEVDGARPWRVFRDVTLPILRPILLILTSLSIIWDFGVFTQPYLLIGQSHIQTSNYLMSIYLFEEGYFKSDFGRGAAISILMLLMVAALSVVYVRRMVRIGDAR